MSAEIIQIGDRRDPGNGAREALIDLAMTLPNDTGRNDAAAWSDWILMELWDRGYKVVRLD
jgi:hypothetical protein